MKTFTAGYSKYQTSPEVLAAIEEIAADRLPLDGDGDDGDKSDAFRIWSSPTQDEQTTIEARAWTLAGADEDELFWGQHTMRRPTT